MKIVSVMSTSGLGGAEFAAVELLDGLIERGHEAVMLSNEPRIGRDTAVPVRPLDVGPKLSLRSWRALMLSWPARVRALRRALEREHPYDVLLVHYKKEQLMARWLPRRLRPALVWAEWGPVPFPLRHGLPRLAFLDAARQADLIIAVSAGTKRSLTDVGIPAERIVYLPNAMRTEQIGFTAAGRERRRAQLGIPPQAFVVGCISRFHPKKRNDVVIDAVRALPDDVHLLLAGEGETEAALRERARPLGERAHFLATPGGDIAEVLSALDVLVFCPSPTEGAPRAVLLGMLAERPCVATGPEGVADIIVPGIGAITEPENDPAALTAVLRGYVEQPERVASEGAEARRRAVAVYDMPVVCAQAERLFAAARHGGRGEGGASGEVRDGVGAADYPASVQQGGSASDR